MLTTVALLLIVSGVVVPPQLAGVSKYTRTGAFVVGENVSVELLLRFSWHKTYVLPISVRLALFAKVSERTVWAPFQPT